MALKVNVKIKANLRCPKHPRYNGNSSPRASCESCQALQKLWIELHKLEGDIRNAIARAQAAGLTSAEAITYAGQNAGPQLGSNQ